MHKEHFHTSPLIAKQPSIFPEEWILNRVYCATVLLQRYSCKKKKKTTLQKNPTTHKQETHHE